MSRQSWRRQVGRVIVHGAQMLLLASGLNSPVRAHQPNAIKVGSLTLERCLDGSSYCGRLSRPLDPAGAISGELSIYFEYYPHTGPGKAIGTLVATEGGPGYAATESRDEYLALFKPLRKNRDFVLMDNRGTGRSGAIDCKDLQATDRWTIELIAACGESLGERSALYGTADAADDLAAILAALGAGKIDLYGDSYGTYFEQVFAVRHPDALRSIVLDGAYPLNGPDYPWYPTYAPAMRDKFDFACQRSPSCAALPGNTLERIGHVLEQLRAHPFTAHALDSDGQDRAFTADASELATVMFAGAPPLAPVRELDAAGRSFLAGDQTPLLRLMAETVSGVDSRDPNSGIVKWSAGLSAAVMCHDPPQIFDMRLAPKARAADRDRALTERRRSAPDTYGPFSIDEFRGMPLDYSFIDECVEWPVAPPDHPASQAGPANALYPDIPALVVSGELDAITTPKDGATTARAFKRGRQLLVANSFHVNALPHARSTCAAGIVRRFIATLDAGDTSCASEVPAVRLVARFAVHAADIDPALALRGNASDLPQRRIAHAAVLTVGDVLARLHSNTSGDGPGLRGGRFKIEHRGATARIVLSGVRWTEDLAVSGEVDAEPGISGQVRAQLALEGPEGLTGHLQVRWREGGPQTLATISGTLAGKRVAAETLAP